jgi:hypothetical protein
MATNTFMATKLKYPYAQWKESQQTTATSSSTPSSTLSSGANGQFQLPQISHSIFNKSSNNILHILE